MSQATSIEWTDRTWNPTHGCSKVSPGCAHCYAEALSLRYRQTLAPWTPANAEANVLLKPHKLREPLSTGKDWRGVGPAAAAAGKTDGMLVFVNSMSDLFHERVPFKYVDRVFETMAAAERHTFQVLTKRPDRMLAYFEYVADYMGLALADLIPWPNVWLGVSVENRRYVDRLDELRRTPAAIRFVSAEPLLGPLVPNEWSFPDGHPDAPWRPEWGDDYHGPGINLAGIDWLIVGGESGPDHRLCDVAWIRQLRDECLSLAPFPPLEDRPALFVKQLGGARPGTALDDLPLDLMFREFPKVAS
jgi:protein gp37